MGQPRFKTAEVPVGELVPYPGNARRGNVDLIAQSLSAYGQYRPLVVQTSTNHVLVGNHTLEAAKRLGWKFVTVHWVDIGDDEARRLLLMDNRTSDKATYDTDDLVELLSYLDNDFSDSGWTEQDLNKLLPDEPDTSPMLPVYQYNVIVECTDETQQAELLARFEAEGLPCKALVT